jgi:hypothetical protein
VTGQRDKPASLSPRDGVYYTENRRLCQYINKKK